MTIYTFICSKCGYRSEQSVKVISVSHPCPNDRMRYVDLTPVTTEKDTP